MLKSIIKICCLFCPILVLISTVSAQEEQTINDNEVAIELDNMLSSNKSDSVVFKFITDNIATLDVKTSKIPIPYLEKAIILADQRKSYRWKGELHNTLGEVYKNLYKRGLAVEEFEKSLTSFKKADHGPSILRMHFDLSGFYAAFDRSDKAQENAYAAITICEKTGNDNGMARANLALSRIFINFSEPEKSFETTNKALAYYESVKDTNGIIRAIGELGYAYTFMDDQEEALVYTNKAIDILKSYSKKSPFQLETFIISRIYICSLLEKHEEAKEDLDYLFEYPDKNRSLLRQFRIEKEHALNTYNREEYDEAKKIMLAAIDDPNKDNNTFLQHYYFHLARIYERTNQYDSVYFYHMLGHQFDTSKKFLESKVNREKLMAEYETGKKEATILAQKEIITQQRTIQWFIGGFLALLGFLFYQTFRNSRSRKKINDTLQETVTKLEAKNEENTVLLKEIHHRVKNNLQTVSSLLSLQSSTVSDPEVLKAIEDSKNRVASIALIHQKLYQGENLATIEMSDYFSAIGQSIIDSFGQSASQVELDVDMHNVELDVDTAVPIGLITNELITNSLKHAFKSTPKPKITIKMNVYADNYVSLNISDNGTHVSSATNASNGTGFGSMLVPLLTKQLGGEIETNIENGTSSQIKFKLKRD